MVCVRDLRYRFRDLRYRFRDLLYRIRDYGTISRPTVWFRGVCPFGRPKSSGSIRGYPGWSMLVVRGYTFHISPDRGPGWAPDIGPGLSRTIFPSEPCSHTSRDDPRFNHGWRARIIRGDYPGSPPDNPGSSPGLLWINSGLSVANPCSSGLSVGRPWLVRISPGLIRELSGAITWLVHDQNPLARTASGRLPNDSRTSPELPGRVPD